MYFMSFSAIDKLYILIAKLNKTIYPFNNFKEVLLLITQIKIVTLCREFMRKQ